MKPILKLVTCTKCGLQWEHLLASSSRTFIFCCHGGPDGWCGHNMAIALERNRTLVAEFQWREGVSKWRYKPAERSNSLPAGALEQMNKETQT